MKAKSNPMIKLFTSQEYDDFYGLPIFNPEARSQFLSFSPKDLTIPFADPSDQIYFLLTLAYFRAKTCLIDFSLKDARNDWIYLKSKYFSGQKVYKRLPNAKQKTRIQNKVLELVGYQRWNASLESSLELDLMIRRHPKVRPFVRALLDGMFRQKIALPAYSTLQRLVTKVVTQEKARLTGLCKQSLTIKTRKICKALLSNDSITSIKQDAKEFNHGELRKEIVKKELLAPLFELSVDLMKKSELPKQTIEYYGSLVPFYSLYKLRRMDPDQAYWYLFCYTFSRYQKVNDNLVQFFKHFVTLYDEEIKDLVKEKMEDLQNKLEPLLLKTGHVLELFESKGLSVKKEKAFNILPQPQMKQVSEFLLGRQINKDLLYWQLVDSYRHKIALNIRSAFLAIDFTTIQKDEFYNLISPMKIFLEGGKDCPNLPIPKKVEPYLLFEEKLIKNRGEFFFYKKVARHIQTQKLTLTYSQRYKSLKEEMIQDQTWTTNKDQILRPFPRLATPIEQLLKEHKEVLNPLLDSVNARIKSGENEHVTLKPSLKETKWSLPYLKKTELSNNPFFLELPQINIIDVLYFVDRHCGFLKAFTPIQSHGSNNPRNDILLIAVILANALRIGSYKMAISAGLNLNEVLTVEKTYLYLEALRLAIDLINNETSLLPIFPYWDIYGIRHGSVDGCKIGTSRDILMARHSIKYYGLGKGVSSNNLITNNLPINTRYISPIDHESHFSFEMFYNNTSDIIALRCSGDGHSVNQINTTLFDMVGCAFMPCFPSIQKKPLSCFGSIHQYDNAIIKPTQQVPEGLIITEWPNVQPILASILQNETDQSRIIAKLSSHDYHSRTKEALWAYDNILKSIYILNYIDDMTIRQGVRTALNRGEAYHQLYRAISYANSGKFRGRTELEIELWSECTRLVASATLQYNARILSLFLDKAQDQKQKDFIIRLSPIAWGHLNFLGRYEFQRPTTTINLEELIKNIHIDPKKYPV